MKKLKPLSRLAANAVQEIICGLPNPQVTKEELHALYIRCRRAGYRDIKQASNFGYIDRLMKLVDEGEIA